MGELKRIKPPETIEEWQEALKSINKMMGKPYCDYQMFMAMLNRRKRVEAKIRELQQKRTNKN